MPSKCISLEHLLSQLKDDSPLKAELLQNKVQDLFVSTKKKHSSADNAQHETPVEKITILGSTGSIGTSTLDVIRANSHRYKVYGLVAGKNEQRLFDQILEFLPERVALFDTAAALALRARMKEAAQSLTLTEAQKEAIRTLDIVEGEAGVCDIAGDAAADQFIGAIVGAAGLRPLLASLKTGKKICLANKEALVMCGKLFFEEAKKYGATIVPVDSEHSAIFQCLPVELQHNIGYCDLQGYGVDKILLTGSGGPFRTCPLEDLEQVTPAMAINHPIWSMGPKISVDSATMMNKALEFVEARYLFNAKDDEIQVVLHPQSVIHSMVSYKDGAVLAELGRPDMRTPIACAMGYPERHQAHVDRLDFSKISSLTFDTPDKKRYPCLYLGIAASRAGQAATTALNAANEEAVAAFLDNKLRFINIATVVEHVLEHCSVQTANTLEEIEAIDTQARTVAQRFLQNI